MATIEVPDGAAVIIFSADDVNYLLLPIMEDEEEVPYHVQLAAAVAGALGQEEIVDHIFSVFDEDSLVGSTDTIQ